MKLDMSAAWNEAVAMVNANREVMAVIAGVFFFLPSLAAVFLLPTMEAPPPDADVEVLEKFLVEFARSNALPFLLMVLTSAVGFIALLALLRDDRKPTVAEAIKSGLFGLFSYLGMELIVGVGAALLLLVLIGVPTAIGLQSIAFFTMLAGFIVLAYVGIKMSLALPVIAIEKVMNPITIIERSWKLTKGNSFRLVLFYALLFIAYIVIASVISLVFGLLLNLLGDGIAFKIADGTVQGVVGAAGSLVFAAILAAVHRQLAGPTAGNLSKTFE